MKEPSQADLPNDPAAKLRLAFDLFQAGEDLMRMNLKRRFPEASDDEIERKLVAWLMYRPID